MPTVALTTLGCKLNSAETSSLGKQFLDRGYALVEFGTSADVAVINTCSVTARADRECRQLIRRARRASPEGVVVVTGCYAQLEPAEVAAIKGVDFVLGTKEKPLLFDFVGEMEKQLYPQVFVSPIASVDNFGPAFSTDAGGRTRAFLKIQDGCDFNCSFCTIPLARGTSRSQSPAECAAQARHLVEEGYREIVLTGVNVGDYGKKTGGSLLELLRTLARVEGLERIRISSIEPNLLTDEIIDFVASTPVMCKHFHVPLQSGSDDILRAMRRRYTTAQYAGRIEAIRRRIPECGIGVDVITGFPGETEARFEETLGLLTCLPVSYLHVFTYSERERTPAAASTGRVEPRIRFRRTEDLRLLGAKKKEAFHRSLIGTTVRVLVESESSAGLREGLTDAYARVAFGGGSPAQNSFVDVLVEKADAERGTGILVEGRRG
jgi:threonylcarbamoyladenosine tRNA methylthiotransferase MtaB